MARIAGVEVPESKRIEVGLTYVHGVGPALSKKVLEAAGINPDTRVKDLKESDVADINAKIVGFSIPVEGELKRMVSQNIRRLIDIKSYRGSRHKVGLPARGQRTSHNARTKKGKRKTVGGMKKKLAKK